MKKRIVSVILFLSFVLSVFALASCGKSGDTEPATESATTPAATEGVTTPAATDAKTGASTEGAPATDAKTNAATEGAPATDAKTGEATEGAPATDAATDPATESDTEPATTADPDLKWETIAEEVNKIAARDHSLKIEYSVKKNAEKSSKNEIYLRGPDSVEPDVTPEIQVMVYNRNRTACELFQITIDYVEWDITYGEQAAQIDTVVKGNDPEAPDLFVNMLYDLNNELVNGSFKDVRSIKNGYFDFSAPGWLEAWMQNLSFTDDRAYILGSDYFLDVFRAVSLLPFNLTMMDNNAAKLAKAILGDEEEYDPEESLSLHFFDLVEEEKWTWDVLGKLCAAIWVDTDGDSQDSIKDTLGIIADRFGGINAASFIYSCGEQLVEAYTVEDGSSPYNGKQWLKYADDSAGLNRIFECVKSVFEGSGSLSTSYTFSGSTEDKPGAAFHHIKFGNGELLFAGACLLGTLEDDAFQNMTDLFSVVPFPKTDASKSYNTIIINQGDAGAINVQTNARKARILSAFLQYCTEHSIKIRQEFLQIVTKYKTTTYDQGTDRMLDLIYDSIIYGRDKTVDDLVGGSNRWHSLLKGQEFLGGQDYISAEYESIRATKQSELDKKMETWYTLPTSK